MRKSICGAECTMCQNRENCGGCVQTGGCPFGSECFIAKYINIGGKEKYLEFKQKLVDEFNGLNVPGMKKINDLYPSVGSFVNLEYNLPNGQSVKFLDDTHIYLANQIDCEFDEHGDRCFGLAAGADFLLVCEYGKNGENPEIIIFKHRIEF